MCAKNSQSVFAFSFLLSTLKKIPTTTGGLPTVHEVPSITVAVLVKLFILLRHKMQFARITVEDLTLKTQWLLDF